MISAGEVGAIFRIVDEASPVLRRLMEQFDALQGIIDRTKLALDTIKFPPGLNTSVGRFEKNLTAISGAADKAASGVSGAFAKIDASVGSTQKLIGDLSGELAAISALASEVAAASASAASSAVARASAAAPRVGGGRSNLRYGHGGDGGGGGGPHIRNVSGMPLGGGFNLGGGGMLPLAAAGAVAYGVYEEAEIEDIAARALLTGQIKVDSGMTQTDAFKSVRDIIQKVSAQTGFSPKEVGEAILTTERQFGGLSFKDRLGLEDTLIPFAAAEARMKETSLSTAFEAMVGLSHMTGTYDSKQLPELMRQFAYASMITPVPIEQFQKAISYSLPMLHAGLDMDPASIMFLTAMTQTAGITNTKSGTWLRSFFENAEPKTGDHLSKSAIMHNEALEKMGLLDAHDNVTWQVKDAAGKTDWDKSIVKMSEIINRFTQTTDAATRLSTLRTAFGERGGGFASLMNLDQFIAQFPVLQAKMKAFQGGENVLTSLTEGSPVQQARNAWADMQNVLIDIGKSVLPPLTGALGAFDAALKKLHAAIGDTGANTVVGGGVLAGGLAWLLGPSRIAKWAGAAGGILSRFSGALWPLGPAYGVKQGADYLDPSGNFWGLTTPIDNWVEAHLGFNPANVGSPVGTGGTPAPSRRSINLNPLGLNRFDFDDMRGGMDREATRGRALGALPAPNVDVKVGITVSGDLKGLINATVNSITQSGEFTHGPSTHDDHSSYAAPDMANF